MLSACVCGFILLYFFLCVFLLLGVMRTCFSDRFHLPCVYHVCRLCACMYIKCIDTFLKTYNSTVLTTSQFICSIFLFSFRLMFLFFSLSPFLSFVPFNNFFFLTATRSSLFRFSILVSVSDSMWERMGVWQNCNPRGRDVPLSPSLSVCVFVQVPHKKAANFEDTNRKMKHFSLASMCIAICYNAFI